MTDRPNLRVVLLEPEIPHNTGAIARLCAATGASLHLVGRTGFHLDDAHLRRAHLDYWNLARVERHVDLATCLVSLGSPEAFYFSPKGERTHFDASFSNDAALVFGKESRGLPDELLARETSVWRIPMLDERVRGLNLATAVGIVVYEALRQRLATKGHDA